MRDKRNEFSKAESWNQELIRRMKENMWKVITGGIIIGRDGQEH